MKVAVPIILLSEWGWWESKVTTFAQNAKINTAGSTSGDKFVDTTD